MPVINPVTGLELLQFQMARSGFYTDNSNTMIDDFCYGGLAGDFTNNWSVVTSGTGSLIAQVSPDNLAGHPGLIEIRAGTASGAAALVRSAFPVTQLLLPTGQWEFRVMLRHSTNVADHVVRVGFGDQAAAVDDITNGVYFELDNSVSPNWFAVCAASGVRTKQDTGIANDTTTYKEYRALGNASSTRVDFYVDDVLRTSITTNIPTNLATAYCAGQVDKGVGAIARSLFVDYYYMGYSFLFADR